MSPRTHTGTVEALRPDIVRVVRHEGARVIYTGFQARGALPRQAVARGLRHSRRSPHSGSSARRRVGARTTRCGITKGLYPSAYTRFFAVPLTT